MIPIFNKLSPAQKWAVIIGLPIMYAMQKAVQYLWAMLPENNITLVLGAVVTFASLFAVPYIYVRSLGTFIAVVIDMVFYGSRD